MSAAVEQALRRTVDLLDAELADFAPLMRADDLKRFGQRVGLRLGRHTLDDMVAEGVPLLRLGKNGARHVGKPVFLQWLKERIV